ncbi:MAG TPA: hypothetical protein VLM20_05295 [Methylophilaceae bacterium]|nr:hypothetical protein [Methylophilaceae bacterium]
MKKITHSPLQVFLYLIAQVVLLLVLLVNAEMLHPALAVLAAISILLTFLWLIVLLLKKLFKIGTVEANDTDEGKKHTAKYPLLLSIALLTVLIGSAVVNKKGGNDKMASGLPAQESVDKEIEKTVREPTAEELVGIWRQILVIPLGYAFDEEDRWFTGEQYFIIHPDNKVKTLVLEGKDRVLDKSTLDIANFMPPAWTLEPKSNGFTLMQHHDGPSYMIRFELFERRMDVDYSKLDPEKFAPYKNRLPEKGDMAVTYFSNDGPRFMRVMRRYTLPN